MLRSRGCHKGFSIIERQKKEAMRDQRIREIKRLKTDMEIRQRRANEKQEDSTKKQTQGGDA